MHWPHISPSLLLWSLSLSCLYLCFWVICLCDCLFLSIFARLCPSPFPSHLSVSDSSYALASHLSLPLTLVFVSLLSLSLFLGDLSLWLPLSVCLCLSLCLSLTHCTLLSFFPLPSLCVWYSDSSYALASLLSRLCLCFWVICLCDCISLSVLFVCLCLSSPPPSPMSDLTHCSLFPPFLLHWSLSVSLGFFRVKCREKQQASGWLLRHYIYMYWKTSEWIWRGNYLHFSALHFDLNICLRAVYMYLSLWLPLWVLCLCLCLPGPGCWWWG